MKKFFSILLITLSIIMPFNVFALSNNYVDKIHNIVDREVEENKINIYLFRGEGCPHCAEEEIWLTRIKKEYEGQVNVYDFEVWYDDDNLSKLESVRKLFESDSTGVPFTVIGDDYYVGFSGTISYNMENSIRSYLGLAPKDNSNLTSNSNIDSNSSINSNSNSSINSNNQSEESGLPINIIIPITLVMIIGICIGLYYKSRKK